MPYYGDHHYGGQHYGGHHSDDRPRRHAERVPEYQKDYEKTMHHADWQKTIDLDSAQQDFQKSREAAQLKWNETKSEAKKVRMEERHREQTEKLAKAQEVLDKQGEKMGVKGIGGKGGKGRKMEDDE